MNKEKRIIQLETIVCSYANLVGIVYQWINQEGDTVIFPGEEDTFRSGIRTAKQRVKKILDSFEIREK